MLPWQPEFQSNQPKNLILHFPSPDDALHFHFPFFRFMAESSVVCLKSGLLLGADWFIWLTQSR